MASKNKSFAAARRVSLLLMTASIASAYVALDEASDRRILREARGLIAYWLMYDHVHGEWEDHVRSHTSGERDRSSTKLADVSRAELPRVKVPKEVDVPPLAALLTARSYYNDIGNVHFSPAGPRKYQVQMSNPSREDSSASHRIPGLEPWSIVIEQTEPIKWVLCGKPSGGNARLMLQRGSDFVAAVLAQRLLTGDVSETQMLELSGFAVGAGDEVGKRLESEKYVTGLRLEEYMASYGIELEPNESNDESLLAAYRKLDTAIRSSSISVPILDIEMSRMGAGLCIFVLVVVFSITFHDQTRSLICHSSEFDDYWLMVDARERAGKYLAWVWLWLVAGLPLLCGTANGVMLWAHWRTGSLSGAVFLLGSAVIAVVLVVLGGLGVGSVRAIRAIQAESSSL